MRQFTVSPISDSVEGVSYSLQVAGQYFTIAETTQNSSNANIRPKKNV